MSSDGDCSEHGETGRWKHGELAVIGVIGGIGAGKSQVSARLAERGAIVIDADAVGHEVLTQPGVIDRIEQRFGRAVIAGTEHERRVDRRAMGAIVFDDPGARHDLESIVHPLMQNQFETEIQSAEAIGEGLAIVLDAAILLEAGWTDLCDRIIFVNASAATRLERVALSRGWSEDQLGARERAQWSNARKRNHADWVVENDSGGESLEHAINAVDRWIRGGCPRSIVSRPRLEDPSPEISNNPLANEACRAK